MEDADFMAYSIEEFGSMVREWVPEMTLGNSGSLTEAALTLPSERRTTTKLQTSGTKRVSAMVERGQESND